MKTRKQYLNKECTHREYYAQFVTEDVIQQVKVAIGEGRILRSTDPHFSDIPLKVWDSLWLSLLEGTFAKFGDVPTLGGKVCIAKEAASQIRGD